MNATEKISQFLVDLSLDDVPAAAIEIAKGGIVDPLGAAIAGTQTEAARIITRWTRAGGGVSAAGVIGGAFKTSPVEAARANGTIGHALDVDPPLALLPVLLALAEAEQASGRDFLAAYIAGFEVQSKLQGGVSKKYTAHGWASNPVFGTFGATAAAAKLLKLDVKQTVMAFGIAASEASGIRQNLGTMTKPFHAGMAAANGVIAATLAREGLSASSDGIGGEFGALHNFATPGEYDERKISETFGKPWDLLAKEIRIKPYPCCRWAHRPLDALLALLQSHDVKPDQVAGIECEVGAQVSLVMTYAVARTELEAKFCLPYCMAVAVCDGRAGLAQFTENRVRDPQVQALATKVRVVHPDGKSEFETDTLLPCVVRLQLKNGAVLEQSVGAARGDRENRMTLDDICEKFVNYTEGLLPSETAGRVLAIVKELENRPDLKNLYSILTFDIPKT